MIAGTKSHLLRQAEEEVKVKVKVEQERKGERKNGQRGKRERMNDRFRAEMAGGCMICLVTLVTVCSLDSRIDGKRVEERKRKREEEGEGERGSVYVCTAQ